MLARRLRVEADKWTVEGRRSWPGTGAEREADTGTLSLQGIPNHRIGGIG